MRIKISKALTALIDRQTYPQAIRTAVVLALATITTEASATDLMVVDCAAGHWEGQRIGFRESGEIENDANAIWLEETTFLFKTPVSEGDKVHVQYGEKQYDGEVRHVNQAGYVTVETIPAQILEVYTIDFSSGRVLLTNTKKLFGLYIDVFHKVCETRPLRSSE